MLPDAPKCLQCEDTRSCIFYTFIESMIHSGLPIPILADIARWYIGACPYCCYEEHFAKYDA